MMKYSIFFGLYKPTLERGLEEMKVRSRNSAAFLQMGLCRCGLLNFKSV